MNQHEPAHLPMHNRNGSWIWRRLPAPVQRGLQAAPLVGPLLKARWLVSSLEAQVSSLKGQVSALVAQRSDDAARLTDSTGAELRQGRESLARIEAMIQEQSIAQNMQVWRKIADNPEARAVGALECFGEKGYSQNEEDGILLEIFRRIGIVHRTFIEVGTGNGLENNTTLLLKQGWHGAWFDGNAQHMKFVRDNFATELSQRRLTATTAMITRENISSLMSGAGFSGEIDLLSIDIDGNDYYVFEQLTGVSPRVVVIEYNAKFPPPLRWIIPYDPGFCWDGSDWFGASLETMNDLFRRKGYALVGCNVTGANAFFVRNDLVANHFHRPGDVAAHYQPARYFLTRGLFAHLGGHPASPRSGLNPPA